MSLSPSWLLAIGPLMLAAVGLVPAARADRMPAAMIRLALAAARGSLAASVIAAVALALKGPMATGVIGLRGVGLSLYYDALTAVMLGLVSFVGAIVLAYSRNYLDGDPGQGRFTKWLCLTLAAVLTLILSGNLLQFVAAWIATSLCLHQLLVFYRERPGAQLAARKKFIASRIGDLCLIGATLLVCQAFGSLDLKTIFALADQMRASGSYPAALHAVAALLVISALLKSAQFPFHGWLPEVMETPTPVSALLHAGIINAGGFLIVRLSPVVSLSTPSLDLLAIVGGFTALFGSVVMLTQTSVKVSLAWSTAAQMGFMLLECGLGAFSAAVLHIVAHSLYKAHAFLSSGSVIDLARASWVPSSDGAPHPARLVLAIAGAVGLTWAVSLAFGASLTEAPGVFALGAVLVMGLTHLIASSVETRPTAFVIGRGAALAIAVAVTYFALQLGAERLLFDALPPNQALRGPLDLAIVGLVLVSFGAVTVLQSLIPYRTASPRWQALYVHLFNGLYVNTLANRVVAKVWPVGADASDHGAKA
jgi:NAD(P)H-quinone oxidoreductase subunit 5